MRLPDIDFTSTSVVQKEYLLNAILSNFRILATLTVLEAFYIKMLAPNINDGLKVSRELVLFK